MPRKRFWDLGGLDESHGSWGQLGTELACKSWLSGGKLITSKKTWFGHMFRTGNFRRHGESSFPYPLSGNAQERAKQYSRDLWLNDKWTTIASLDLGGFGAGGNKLQVGAKLGLDVQPWDNTSIEFGYQYYSMDFSTTLSTGVMAYDTTQHGPYIGVKFFFN